MKFNTQLLLSLLITAVASLTCTPKKEVRKGDNYIGVVFNRCPSEDVFKTIMEATGSWSSLITEVCLTVGWFIFSFRENQRWFKVEKLSVTPPFKKISVQLYS